MVTNLIIGCGASLGAILRWLMTLTWQKFGRIQWPVATLCINLTGSFLLGWLTAISLNEQLLSFLTTGLLGGYTTFSTFNTELIELLHEGRRHAFLSYLLISSFGGVLFAWLGMQI